jgi:hypothetical protein
MPKPNVVEQYWTGVASQLQVEAGVFNRLVGHNGEMGRANELALARLITTLIPASLGVGTGMVIDNQGRSSKQCDLIIFDLTSQPQMLAHSTQLLFPVETVLAVIEVKTTVDNAAIEDVGEKCAELAKLTPLAPKELPLTALFGYRASGRPHARAASLNALDGVRSPTIAAILDPGLVSSRDAGGSLNMGLVPLHETDAAGSRLSESWAQASDEGKALEAKGNQSFPVARLAADGERYLFEPGRALLLFANQLLTSLSRRTPSIDASWLDGYLPEVARETVVPNA